MNKILIIDDKVVLIINKKRYIYSIEDMINGLKKMIDKKKK